MIFRRPKPALTLHIGLGKTGTTVLQEFFWANRKLLEKNGITYPDYGVVAGAHHLLSPHIPPYLKNVWNFKPAEEWAPKLARSRAAQTLLSSELISSGQSDVITEFCTAVCERFKLRIVVYLRRQDHLIMASYNQHVKTGKQRRKLSEIYQNMVRRFDFEATLKPWVDAIGAENIVVRPYEREQFYGNDIRLDFLYHAFGVEIDDELQLGGGNANPRLDTSILEYKRLLNNIVSDGEKLLRLQRLLTGYCEVREATSADKQSLLPAAIRLEILAGYEQQNNAIARTYLGRTDGKLFLELPPNPGTTWQDNVLSPEEATSIAVFLAGKDPSLMQWLSAEVPKFVDSEQYGPRIAARFLAGTL